MKRKRREPGNRLVLGVLISFCSAFTILPLTPFATPVFSQTGDVRQREADRLLEQATQQFRTSQFEAAFQSAQQALQRCRELKYQKGEARALRLIGNVYYIQANYPKAIDYYQQSISISKQIGDRANEGKTLGNLGSIALGQGKYAESITYYQQSLTIAREMQDRPTEANALGNLGLVYENLGDYPRSKEFHQQQLTLAQSLKDRDTEASALSNLGSVESQLKNNSRAIELYQQSLTLFREVNNRLSEATVLGNLGFVYTNLGEYRKALDYQQQRLRITRELQDRQGEAEALGNLGQIHFYLQEYEPAVEVSQTAIRIARSIQNRKVEAVALNNAAIALAQLGRLDQAEEWLQKSIEVYETLREGLKDSDRISIADIQRNPYSTLQAVLVARQKVESALEVSERSRTRAFVELLAARGQITAANRQAAVQPIRISDIQQLARTRQATLVEYSVTNSLTAGDQLFIWVVKPSGEVIFRQVDLKPLQQKQGTLISLVTESRGSIGVRGLQFKETSPPLITAANVKNSSLQELHALLIAPIADLLPQNPEAPVIFVPQGELFLIPFAALQDPSGKYLIERHTILISPSIQVLQLISKRTGPSRPKESLIVGNPTMPKVRFNPQEIAQLPSLPGAEKEAKTIATLLKSQPLLGAQATESAVLQKMPQSRLIHLATHGLLDDFGGTGIPGAIALAPDAQRDGLLTAAELLGLKLNADLVVLSACDTGRGRITGDGVIGLSRSLITAGASSVIVSLWQVPDAPTAFLMGQFYQTWQQNHNTGQALRQAMLKTLKEYPDPKAWAAFTLVGNHD
ncbi:MAG: CHAT domain-containing tetratricopeptide repeat protein [Leptolyngbyaceae cyanobacterium bins.59]|nr:CHAT domain-containing tetratricopeptide repeat protein [Leptolyngbyaceae cyanobacterium bins.59]